MNQGWPHLTTCDQMDLGWPHLTTCDTMDPEWPHLTTYELIDPGWPHLTTWIQDNHKWPHVTRCTHCDSSMTTCDQMNLGWPHLSICDQMNNLDLEMTFTFKWPWPWNDIRLSSLREFPPCFPNSLSCQAGKCLTVAVILTKHASLYPSFSALASCRPLCLRVLSFVEQNQFLDLVPACDRCSGCESADCWPGQHLAKKLVGICCNPHPL